MPSSHISSRWALTLLIFAKKRLEQYLYTLPLLYIHLFNSCMLCGCITGSPCNSMLGQESLLLKAHPVQQGRLFFTSQQVLGVLPSFAWGFDFFKIIYLFFSLLNQPALLFPFPFWQLPRNFAHNFPKPNSVL